MKKSLKAEKKAAPIKTKEGSVEAINAVNNSSLPNGKEVSDEKTGTWGVKEAETEVKPIEPQVSDAKESGNNTSTPSSSPEPVANPPKMTWASKLMNENSDRISKNNTTVEYIRPETLPKKPTERKFEMGNRRDNASANSKIRKNQYSAPLTRTAFIQSTLEVQMA
nr:CMF_HP1_G0046170.mRNA.1.CDS.1 [Saccharomyces cerevisiae]